jgi:glucans biosynthesis protein C
MNAQTTSRRYDLDWLRVLLILTVFFFHTGMFFNGDYFHVENALKSRELLFVHKFLMPIMMPAIFIISAAAIGFSLRRLSPGRFILERAKRLLIPLVFGIFVLSPHQVYLEGLTHGGVLQSVFDTPARSTAFDGSFLQFLPHYFDGFYAFGGSFAWMGLHLWYLEFLFIFTVILLPIFLFLRSKVGAAMIRALAGFCSRKGAVYLLALIIIVPLTFLEEDGLGFDKFGGNSLIIYMIDMLLGFILFADERFRDAIVQQRFISLAAGLVMLYPFFYEKFNSGLIGEFDALIDGLFSWLWILTLLGFGMKHLNVNSRMLSYANEAVLPFYMLHQPVLLIVGYFVVQLSLPVGMKYMLIVLLSFPIIMLVYEYVVRRVNVLRFFFGLKPLAKVKHPETVSVQPVA